MRTRILKSLAVILIFILALPVIPAGTVTVNAAATPTLSMSSKTLVGIGATFTLSLKNLDTSKVKRTTFYSQNEKVAIVDAKTGVVTSVGKGTTNVKCKITYKNGDIERPACKVTVKIPATAVKINNAKDYAENNNRHVIAVGDSYDFNRTLTPSDASDKTYWFIDDIDDDVNATVVSNGTVTGIKPGLIRLRAVASLTPDGVDVSKINDIINIEIVEKTASVKEVLLTDSSTIRITFDRPMNASMLLAANQKLTDNITITAKTDAKGYTAAGFGELTGSLSTDGLVLTIKATKTFNGLYGIHLSSNIKSTDGTAISAYYENLELYDSAKPQFNSFTVDGTGLKVSINFSEPMDFTNLRIDSAKPSHTGIEIQSTTLSILLQRTNYVQSADKKSLIIDLTNIPAIDQNKTFTVVLSGLLDLSGNAPANYPHQVFFATDTTPKPQAQVMNVQRTGYNTLTATFTRAIKSPGMIQINNIDWVQGIVDINDNTKVNYTISNNSALLTGIQKISIGHWDSFNVNPSDTTASQMKEYTVNFTIDGTIPVIQKQEFYIETTNGADIPMLALTYNKNVTLLSSTGTFAASLRTPDNNLYSDRILTYTAIVSENKVTIVFDKSQLSESGVYTITIPQGFVRDSYMNMNQPTTVNVNKNAAVASVLSAPKDIKQSSEDLNVIYVTFDKKLDEMSATNVANYQISGVTIISATLMDNNPSGATVKLTVLPDTILSSTIYPITISGISGYQNSYSVMAPYQNFIALNENKAPRLTKIDFTAPYTIILTFDEDLQGSSNFKLMQNGVELPSSSIVNGRTILINLQNTPTINVTIQVIPTQYNLVKDMSGNIVTMSTQYVVPTY